MRRLPSLFRSIALASLAASAGGCFTGHSIDRSRFRESVCDGATYAPLLGIKPAKEVDGVQLVSTSGGFVVGDTGFAVAASVGTMCATASDKAACEAKVTDLAKSEGGWTFNGADWSETHKLIITKDDEVTALRSLAEVRVFFGAIDTVKEAAFLVSEERVGRFECPSANARTTDSGFELLVRSGSGCGRGDDVELKAVSVSHTGVVAVTETEVLKEGDPNCAIGRRTEGLVPPASAPREDLGAFFAQMAHLEGAAVPAFERLARELRAHGAPAHLSAAAERSARDEVRHARAVAKLARRFGHEPPPVVVEELPVRSLEAIALENATEGCVRESFGAIVATYQAHAARDEQIARVMRGIARDETRHAELSWEVARWIREQLDDGARARVDAAVRAAIVGLRGDLATPACEDAVALAGFPVRDVALAMFDRARDELWAA